MLKAVVKQECVSSHGNGPLNLPFRCLDIPMDNIVWNISTITPACCVKSPGNFIVSRLRAMHQLWSLCSSAEVCQPPCHYLSASCGLVHVIGTLSCCWTTFHIHHTVALHVLSYSRDAPFVDLEFLIWATCLCTLWPFLGKVWTMWLNLLMQDQIVQPHDKNFKLE